MEKFGLALNVNKCHKIIFTRRKIICIEYNYFINGISILFDVDSVALLLFKLFYLIVRTLIKFDVKILDFVKIIANQLNLSCSLKDLYGSLIIPILEYDSVVWGLATTVDSRRLELVYTISRHINNCDLILILNFQTCSLSFISKEFCYYYNILYIYLLYIIAFLS